MVLLLFHLLTFLSLAFQRTVDAQVPIPPRYDGFVYRKDHARVHDSIEVEAFFDPLCPYSKEAWPPLKQALDYYHLHRFSVSFVVHTFPLPYHDNAFVASRALHIADKLNSSTTYHLLELFYKFQEKYYNKPTREMSRASIVNHIAKLAAKAVGPSSLPDIESGFKDAQTDHATRISFKYACSRGVTGTPSFFINGFPAPDSDSTLNYTNWRSIIDPLLG